MSAEVNHWIMYIVSLLFIIACIPLTVSQNTSTTLPFIITPSPISTTRYHSTTTDVPNPSSSSDHTRFAICHKLNRYGCNPTSIPDIVELYINNGIDGYILPSNPCEFDNINMTWIFTQVDSSVLNLVTDNSYFEGIPCQLLIQLPWLLQERDLNYLIDDNYWFGDDPKCDITNTDNNLYNITECDYETRKNDSNGMINNPNITQSYDECPNDDICYYPFVRTRFKSDKLKDFGMCHCQESCRFRFYGGDIQILDIYNQSCCWISLIFIIGYFINLFLEYRNIRKQNHKIKDLPLTFDIPFFCASALLGLTLCQLLPYLLGKDYFSCESGTEASIRASKLPHANWSCFAQGSVIYVAIITIYTYFMVLSFCVWRYLHRPLKPLYGIHKKWWHLAIWIYILGMYIALVVDTPNKSMGANTILGICGSHLFTKPESYIFNWYPLLFMIITFAIITPLTLYKLFKILNGKRMMNESQEIYNKELIHLSIRLVLYTSLLCASCICFMYIIGELLFNREMWNRIAEEYVFCLVFETYLTDQGFNGDLSKCILDENNELPISIYFMQGTVVLLASSASFVLSCSNARLNQWKKVETKIALKMKSVSSIGSRENSRNNMTENTSNGSKSSKIRGIDIYLPSPRMKQVKSKSFTDTNDMIDTSKSGLSGQQRKQSIIGSHQGIITATSTPDINHDLIKEQSPSPPPLQLNLTKTKSNEEIEMGKV